MGLIFCDGFDSYSTSSGDLARNWTGLTISGFTWNSTAGRNGGGALQAASVANPTISIPQNIVLATANSTFVGGCFWLKASAAPSSNTAGLFDAYNSGISAPSWYVKIVPTTGLLQLISSSGSTLTTGVTSVCDNSWHWIEITGAAGNNNQNYKCYVDGTVQWNASYQCGNGNNVVNIVIGATSSATNTYTFDDIFIFDQQSNQSPVPADVPIGQRQIDTIRPSTDSSVQFTATGTGSTNADRVKEVAADDDTTYVQDNTSGHADEYTYSALGFTPASITAVQMVTRAKNPSGGSIQYKERCHSGATTSDGSAITTPAAYGNSRRNLNQDPNTSAAWTATNLANVKFGFTVV